MAIGKRTSASSYFVTYGVLLALATTSLLFSVLHAPGGLPLSLTVAAVKAAAVLWIFMHLREQSAASALAILLAVLWIALLGGIMIADVMSRRTFPDRPRPGNEDVFYRR